jgi:hypothetical protein
MAASVRSHAPVPQTMPSAAVTQIDAAAAVWKIRSSPFARRMTPGPRKAMPP